jgi:hypothetical protein
MRQIGRNMAVKRRFGLSRASGLGFGPAGVRVTAPSLLAVCGVRLVFSERAASAETRKSASDRDGEGSHAGIIGSGAHGCTSANVSAGRRFFFGRGLTLPSFVSARAPWPRH